MKFKKGYYGIILGIILLLIGMYSSTTITNLFESPFWIGLIILSFGFGGWDLMKDYMKEKELSELKDEVLEG